MARVRVRPHNSFSLPANSNIFQACGDLGFPFADDDWRLVKKKLDHTVQGNVGVGDKIRVGDFFSSLHHVIRAKQRQDMNRIGAAEQDGLKVR